GGKNYASLADEAAGHGIPEGSRSDRARHQGPVSPERERGRFGRDRDRYGRESTSFGSTGGQRNGGGINYESLAVPQHPPPRHMPRVRQAGHRDHEKDSASDGGSGGRDRARDFDRERYKRSSPPHRVDSHAKQRSPPLRRGGDGRESYGQSRSPSPHWDRGRERERVRARDRERSRDRDRDRERRRDKEKGRERKRESGWDREGNLERERHRDHHHLGRSVSGDAGQHIAAPRRPPKRLSSESGSELLAPPPAPAPAPAKVVDEAVVAARSEERKEDVAQPPVQAEQKAEERVLKEARAAASQPMQTQQIQQEQSMVIDNPRKEEAVAVQKGEAEIDEAVLGPAWKLKQTLQEREDEIALWQGCFTQSQRYLKIVNFRMDNLMLLR
ncbi:unnamed protein product, partial [Chrysoparadoxa australica]